MRQDIMEAVRAYIEGLQNPMMELGLKVLLFTAPVLIMNLLLYSIIRNTRLLRRTPAIYIFLPTWVFLCLALLILLLGAGDAVMHNLSTYRP